MTSRKKILNRKKILGATAGFAALAAVMTVPVRTRADIAQNSPAQEMQARDDAANNAAAACMIRNGLAADHIDVSGLPPNLTSVMLFAHAKTAPNAFEGAYELDFWHQKAIAPHLGITYLGGFTTSELPFAALPPADQAKVTITRDCIGAAFKIYYPLGSERPA